MEIIYIYSSNLFKLDKTKYWKILRLSLKSDKIEVVSIDVKESTKEKYEITKKHL